MKPAHKSERSVRDKERERREGKARRGRANERREGGKEKEKEKERRKEGEKKKKKEGKGNCYEKETEGRRCRNPEARRQDSSGAENTGLFRNKLRSYTYVRIYPHRFLKALRN